MLSHKYFFPLSNKLNDEAYKVFLSLSKRFDATFDTTGSIGKRYRREDAIGTPFCVTFDFNSLEDKQVTIRERDSMEQKRIPISDLSDYLYEQINKDL